MRYSMLSVLAVGLAFAAGHASRASDTVRLGGPSAESAILGGATDTELVRGYHGGGGYHGGYGRGYYGGGYGRGYYGGGYGRGYYGGYYGRGYYGGYYRPYYYGGYYQPYYYGSYYGGGGYYGGGYGGGYYGIGYNGCASVAPLSTTQTIVYSQPWPSQQYSELLMPPTSNGNNGTYPYNGGPSNPIPLPSNGNSAPMYNAPRGIVPLDGKLVSLPTETTGGVSPVVIPTVQRTSFVSTTNSPASSQLNPTPARIAYPAYGDESIPPAARKNVTP